MVPPPAKIHRHANPGTPPRLAPAQQQHLVTRLDGPAPEGGLWTGPKVGAWITAQTGQPTRPQVGWTYLRRRGFPLQTPRPRHTQAALPEPQAAWNNNSTCRSRR